MDGIDDVFGIQTIHWNGQTLTVPRPDFTSERDMKTALQQSYYNKELKAQKSYMDAADYEMAMRNFQMWCNSGYFGYGNAGFSTALNDEANMVEILYIVLKQEGTPQLDKGQILKMIKEKNREALDHNRALLAADPAVDVKKIKTSETTLLINNWFEPNPTTPPGEGEKAKS